MSRTWAKLLCVDTESTCREDPWPEGTRGEIIQVGVSVWDCLSDSVSDPVTYYCRPVLTEVTPFCTALTGITQKRVAKAESFEDVCGHLEGRWGSANKAWAAYGNDAEDFREMCAGRGCRYPFGEVFFDVSMLCVYRGLGRWGLSDALARAGLAFEGTPHRAGDDAYNCARLMRALMRGNP